MRVHTSGAQWAVSHLPILIECASIVIVVRLIIYPDIL